MNQTTVFDNNVISFDNKEFTVEQIKEKLKNDPDWHSNNQYILNCIKDRLKKKKIELVSYGIYRSLMKETSIVSEKEDSLVNDTLTLAEVIYYDKQFLNQKNVGMKDDYISVTKPIKIIEKAIANSYIAATKDTIFYKEVAKDKNLLAKEEKLKDALCLEVKKAILLFDGEDYRSWHSNLSKSLIKIANELGFNNLWTYGNSQKIINLATKYIYIVGVRLIELRENADFNKISCKFIEIVNELDIPIDRYILRATYNFNNAHSKKKIIIPMLKKTTAKFQDSFVKCWSSFNEDDYLKYATSLHNALVCPIKWEGYAWVSGKIEAKKG